MLNHWTKKIIVEEGHTVAQLVHILYVNACCIGLSRHIATAALAIIAVFQDYLSQFLIDLHQIYRHSSVPKNTSPCNF